MYHRLTRLFQKRCQPLSILLTGLLLTVSIIIGQVIAVMPVQAALTPEATQYELDRGNSQVRLDPGSAKPAAEESGEGIVQSLKDTAETVREKLNLDEPLPEGTKLFLKQVQGEDVEVKEPRPAFK